MNPRSIRILTHGLAVLAGFAVCAVVLPKTRQDSGPAQSQPRNGGYGHPKTSAVAPSAAETPEEREFHARIERIESLDESQLIPGLLRNAAGPPSAERLLERQLLLVRQAQSDPVQAWSYVTSLPADEQKDALVTVLGTWAMTAPEEAADHFETSVDDLGSLSPVRGAGAGAIAAAWVLSDSEAAFHWAGSLPADLSGSALAAAASALMDTDAEKIANVVNGMVPGFERTELIQAIALEQTRVNPAAAAKWVMSIDPNGGEQSAAVTTLVEGWSRKDPLAAAAWVKSLPAGTLRDAAENSLPEEVHQ